jgi:kumamolisin
VADDAVEGNNAASRASGYLVSDILEAYGGSTVVATGIGQTIAILIDTFPHDADLQEFWQANKLPDGLSRITKINVPGGTLPEIEGEESLDAEWASAVAPEADVRIYASGELSFVALDRALDAIIADLPEQPGLRQLSISLRLGEIYFEPAKDEIATQQSKFLRLAAAGVNVFVSSGDAGSNPRRDPWAGGGGGKSHVFGRPVWQTGATISAGSKRLVPDVSLVADPATGGMVVINGRKQPIGGTSWSAPTWAAFCARINDARSKVGKPALGFLNPLLYPLNGTLAFRDITSGSNGAYDASPGYDMVTGLGTPNLAELINALP